MAVGCQSSAVMIGVVGHRGKLEFILMLSQITKCKRIRTRLM